MKKNSLLTILLLLTLAFISCDDFLDELPDKRAELNTPQKIAQILVSAYPTEMPTMMYEIMSDNTIDNGPLYNVNTQEQTIIQAYKYQAFTETAWDVPQRVWQLNYSSIAAANQALAAIEELGNLEATNGSKAEALLCRAFGHFTLVNTFSMAYNPVSSTTDFGIPYIEAPETTVSPKYERGTVASVYELINRDIEEALPLLNDNYSQPKYHFNSKAAYAFAARFNLFYGKWDKAIEYATKAIGENPTSQFRDVVYVSSHAQPIDRFYAYIDKDADCNLLILPQRSLWGRIFRMSAAYARYAHARSVAYHTIWQNFPWDDVANGYNSVFGSTQNVYFPKIWEIFEYTNVTTGSGQPHTVLVPFTVEETLMCRAEANVMLGKFDDAVRDLNYWYAYSSPANSTFTAQQISAWYAEERPRTPRHQIESRFNVSEGLQDNLLRAVLAIRRIEGIHLGLRWLDIKRHGITVNHPVYSSTTEYDMITLEAYDKRTAIQLPQDVISAGIPANPQDDVTTTPAIEPEYEQMIVDQL